MDDDSDLPSDIAAYDPRQEQLQRERAENHRRLEKISVGNRFRLMFGQSMLPDAPPAIEFQGEEPDL